jgi:DNA polymerase-1
VQWGSATGRLASRDPNLQNIPIKTEQGKAIRQAFIASPGYTFASLDYSQIDLRSLAILSKDPKLTEFFRSGGDIHELVAREIFAPEVTDNLFENNAQVKNELVIDREMRRKAKVINFGIIYGMGVMALKQTLGVSKDEAQIFYDKYFERFPGVRKYLDDTIMFAHKTGYTETLFGRKRYYPEINRGPEYVQKSAERQASNAPVQGTSADIIKVAMLEVDKWIKKEKLEGEVRLLLQIHDELIYEIKSGHSDKLLPQIKSIMESVVPDSPVPIPVKFSTGGSWSEL